MFLQGLRAYSRSKMGNGMHNNPAEYAAAPFRLAILGPFEFVGPDGPIKLTNRKLAGMLAYLACAGAAGRDRDPSMTLLWGSHFDVQARQNLRQALTRVRRILGPESVVTSGENIALVPSLLACDAVRFEDLLRSRTVDDLAEAVRLYRGAFLADIAVREEAWAEWANGERRRYEIMAADAMTELGWHELKAARPTSSESLARRVLTINDMREDAHRLLLHSLAALGRRADALRHYENLARRLAEELDTKPDAATQAIAAELRARSAPPTASAPRAITMPAAASPPAQNDGMQVNLLAQVDTGGPASLAVVTQQTTVDQSDRLASIVPDRLRSTLPFSGAGPGNLWLIQPLTVAEAASLALRLKSAHEATRTVASQSVLRIGAHSGPSASEGAADLPVALANVAKNGEIIASQEFRDLLVDGLYVTIRDLGFVSSWRSTVGSRVFAMEPSDSDLQVPTGSRVRPAIAVLPFDLRAANDADITTAELLADEIIGALSLSKQVDVISRLSTRALGVQEDPGWIGSRLQADYVIASKRTASEELSKLAVELIESKTGIVRWSGSRPLDGGGPEEIRDAANWITSEVMAAILISESERVTAKPLASLDSYTLLFAAITLMDRWTLPSFQRSGQLLRELRARTPTHPTPNAWLSAWHIRSISQGWTTDATADGKAAIEFAQRSLDADPHCSVALTMDGWANAYALKRLDIAADRLARAVESNPNDSLAWLLKGVVDAFRSQGEDAAIAAERAIRLSPLDPRRSYYDSMAASAALAAGRYGRAIELATRSLRVNRLHASTLRVLAVAQWQLGQHDAARQSVTAMLALEPGFTIAGYLSRHPASQSASGTLVANALRAAGAPP